MESTTVMPTACDAQTDPVIVCLDVDYRDVGALAAGIWFRGWKTAESESQVVTFISEVSAYQPGQFFRRELPCLLKVLELGPKPDVVLVDGYVWLGQDRPGLGAHLHEAIGGIVVGVAKTCYAGATDAVAVHRGGSRVPLYVTAAGVSNAEAASWVKVMHGLYRIPTLLKKVDGLARSEELSPKT